MRRGALVTLVVAGVFGYGVLRVPWVAPLCADVARKILGPAAVACLEDKVYGLADGYNQWRYRDATPPSYWAAPPEIAPGKQQAPPLAAAGDAGAPAVTTARAFPPPDFTPTLAAVAGKADGTWIALADDVEPAAPAVMAKTLVHPDAARAYAQVALVALDLASVRISAVAGTAEPASTTVRHEDRPGKIPERDQPRLIAAFNGGWQAVHGGFGMMVDGRELLPPKDGSCTVVLYKNRGLRIAPWPDVASERDAMQAFRQTPPCLVTAGVENKGLSEGSKGWGAAVDGATGRFPERGEAHGVDRTSSLGGSFVTISPPSFVTTRVCSTADQPPHPRAGGRARHCALRAHALRHAAIAFNESSTSTGVG